MSLLFCWLSGRAVLTKLYKYDMFRRCNNGFIALLLFYNNYKVP